MRWQLARRSGVYGAQRTSVGMSAVPEPNPCITTSRIPVLPVLNLLPLKLSIDLDTMSICGSAKDLACGVTAFPGSMLIPSSSGLTSTRRTRRRSEQPSGRSRAVLAPERRTCSREHLRCRSSSIDHQLLASSQAMSPRRPTRQERKYGRSEIYFP